MGFIGYHLYDKSKCVDMNQDVNGDIDLNQHFDWNLFFKNSKDMIYASAKHVKDFFMNWSG